MKIAKATAMLLGFPLFSFVLFVASFLMIQQEHAGNFAMNWLIVTIVIWVFIAFVFVIALLGMLQQVIKMFYEKKYGEFSSNFKA